MASLLELLKAEQADPFQGFPDGFFYCTRWHKLGYVRPDNNVFIQALACFSLQRAAATLSESTLKEEILGVCGRISQHYPRYRSFVGLDTYGFWQLRPKRGYFPFGNRLHRDEFFRPPDDADDTVIIYLTSHKTPEAKRWLHEVKLPQHANRPEKRVHNSFADWQTVTAYTTFFADAMPSGFDVSVMANILYWVFEEGFELNAHDRATISLVEDAVLSGKLVSDSYRCSPYYPALGNILYNLARVISKFPSRFKNETVEMLRTTIHTLPTGRIKHPMEELMIVNAGLLLEKPIDHNRKVLLKAALNDQGFSFFALPLAQEYNLKLAKFLSPRQYLHLKFNCRAFNAAMLIEYYSLLNKYSVKDEF
jgi:hypothetical protein